MTNSKYAGFLLRLLAELVEWQLFTLVLSYSVFIIAQSSSLSEVLQGLVKYFVLFGLPLGLLSLFIRSFFTSQFGGNIGKLLTGLRVENLDQHPLSFKRSLFRHTIGYTFSSILLFLGYFAVIKDPKKQAFHDKAIGSYVVIRQTLWPLALILLLVSLLGNYYFFSQAYSKAMSGPLKFEVAQLVIDYQQQKKNAEATGSAKPLSPLSSPSPSPTANTGNIIFVSLKDSATSDQAQPLVTQLESNPSVLRVQFLSKEDATKAYQSVAPGQNLPATSLTPVLIIYLKDINSNIEILNEVKSDPLVQAAYPYSL